MQASSADRRTERPVPVVAVEAWAKATAAADDKFNELAAQHAVTFFERYLKHTKGQWAGQPFKLLEWQRALVRTIFGWKRADGTRRFRVVYVEVPRKNGKTGLAAGIALYLAFCSGEVGAEVYCAASEKAQAAICFNEAKRMRAQSSYMRQVTDAYKFNISAAETFSKLEVLSSESETKDGLNISGLVGDELHAWRDRHLYDVLHTATGARRQPLEFLITTAGVDKHSICWELHEHAAAVRDGIKTDHEFLPVIYAAGQDDQVDDPSVWAKANPSIGDTISVEYLRKEAERAKQMPRYMNAFKRLHLNVWTDQQTLWLPMDRWDACGEAPETVSLETLAGRECWGGLDLAATTDLTALVLIFPRGEGEQRVIDILPRFWLPKEGIAERSKRDRVPYDLWASQGLITLTDGNVVDYDRIRADIAGTGGFAERFNIIEIARDRWNATQITTQLMGDGVHMVEFGQGYASMSAPSKELEKLVLSSGLNHGGNPVLRWMASVVTVEQDAAGNIKPVKPRRNETPARIDGIVALIMALGRSIAQQNTASIFNREELWA